MDENQNSLRKLVERLEREAAAGVMARMAKRRGEATATPPPIPPPKPIEEHGRKR